MSDPNEKQLEALKFFLLKSADDQLILGHRNSEWTGLGPILEEDIAFSSMAQDKIGQSQQLYNLLHQLGEDEPDNLAFTRNEKDFFCCQFVEYPIGEYDFSLMRHFLFDTADAIRFMMLENSSYEPLAKLARKFRGEIKYHTMHANTWMKQLGTSTEESKSRMQSALNECMPLAYGIFEPTKFEDELKEAGIFPGEAELQTVWEEKVTQIITGSGLQMPVVEDKKSAWGGRGGIHTEYLQPLLDEMTEVFRIDPHAEW